MTGDRPSRPKRLLGIAILNIAAALLSISFLLAVFLRFPARLRPDALSAALTLFLGVTLIVSCVLALIGHPFARWLALGCAIVFFGLHLINAALLLVQDRGLLPSLGMTSEVRGAIVNNSLGIVLNLWSFLSDETDIYFESSRERP